MIGVEFQKISAADIRALVENAVREGKTIEYKEQLPTGRDDGKKEFLADVSSFANASGGDLVYGVSEARDADGRPTGIPHTVVGLPDINADQEILRLQSMIRDGLDPRIPGFQIKAVDGIGSGPVIVVRIPKSWASPHMVTFKASPRFFSRTSNGKSPLDVAEVRAAFVESESLPERIRRFREERLGNILTGETPVMLAQEPLTVLHLIPVSNFHSKRHVDVLPFLDGQFQLSPLGGGGYSARLNIDGYVTFCGSVEDGAPSIGYTQLFRNGAIEAVATYLFGNHRELKRLISSFAFERAVVQATINYTASGQERAILADKTAHISPFTVYFKAYRDSGVDAPVVAMLSLLHVRGFSMYADEFHRFNIQHRIDKQHLLLPEVVVEDLAAPVPTTLRPVFDLLWQACGHRQSLNYDEQGNWRQR